jgi:hypothetical protein
MTTTTYDKLTQNLMLGEEVLFSIPVWIDAERFTDLDADDLRAEVQAIAEHGCMSGAYMPAVTYHLANKTMAEHGDAVMDYIQDVGGFTVNGNTVLPKTSLISSWTGLAVHFLSHAVDTWAGCRWNELYA